MSDVFQTPAHWKLLKLPEVAFFQEGPGLRKFQYRESGVPFLNIRTLADERVDKSKCQFLDPAEVKEKYEHFLVETGDIICSSSGTIGKTAIIQEADKPLMLNTSIIRFRPHIETQLSPGFLHLFLKSQNFLRQAISASTGSAQVNFGPSHLRNFNFPLPPLAEQKRIVAKIEELFSELEAGEESLRVARRQLGVYRQSLLKQAFEGKLTEKWRTQNPAKLGKPTSEPASDVGPIPREWVWSTLKAVAEVTGGLTKNSKRDSFAMRIPYLRVANVYANELRLEEIKDIGVAPEEAKKVRLAKGDLLIVEGNGSLDQIGRVAVWDGSIPNCGHQNHLIRARCRAMAEPVFVLMFLLSPRGRSLIEEQAASTSGLHTLSVSKVQRLPAPLCSLAEQKEIVRLLDAQFEVIEQNVHEIDAALQRSEALRQAILKKAFTGRLVAQNPADEPASALLARLRSERGLSTASATPQGKKGAKPS